MGVLLFRWYSQQQAEEAAKQRLVVLFVPRFDGWAMKPIDETNWFQEAEAGTPRSEKSRIEARSLVGSPVVGTTASYPDSLLI